LDINEIEAQILEIENKIKILKLTRESFDKVNDSNLKQITSYLNNIELNSCAALDEIIIAQNNFKKDIKEICQYFGEEEKNFKPIEFLKLVSDFVRNFKKACLYFLN